MATSQTDTIKNELCEEDSKDDSDVLNPLCIDESVGNTGSIKASCSPSLDSSRESSPYTKRESSPTNGILTPPIEENDVHANDTCKQEHNPKSSKATKSGGRLKFFKDGILCLELTHHNEGAKTKWVQIKSKTVFPTIVHAKKEATIPCHVGSSGSSIPLNSSRVESSTSHSVSDDGSSILSSPRTLRDASFMKQSVPRKEISSWLELYFTSAPCIVQVRKNNASQRKHARRPYSLIQLALETPVQCTCMDNTSSMSNSVLASKTEKPYSSPSSKLKKLDSIVTRLGDKAKDLFLRNISSPIASDNAEKPSNANGSPSPPQKFYLTPKKRAFKETEVDLRPKSVKKTSPIEKTILNVPELSCRSKFSSSGHFGSDRNSRLPEKMNNKKSPNKKARHRSPSGNSGKPISLLKPELMNRSSSSGSNSINSLVGKDSISALKEAPDLFMTREQQQAMSNAISYTINSLLGNGDKNVQEHSNKPVDVPIKKQIDTTCKTNKIRKKTTPEIHPGLFEATGTDQNSFLRHLLDTSDPIPASTSPPGLPSTATNSVVQSNKLEGTNHHVYKKTMQSTTSQNASKSSNSSSSHLKSSKPGQSSSSSTGFDQHYVPFPTSTSNGINSELASAFNQYQNSLGFFPHLNAAAAAAAMASYLNPANASHSSRAPVLPHGLNIPSGLLASATGAWPVGAAAFPFPTPYTFHEMNGRAKNNGESSIRVRSETSTGNSSSKRNDMKNLPIRESDSECKPYDLSIRGSSRQNDEKMRLQNNNVDEDAPLDLCKKR